MNAILRPPLLGGLSGLAALALDTLFAWLTLGYRLSLEVRFVAAYLLVGAGLGVLLGLGHRFLIGRRRTRLRDRTMIAAGLALIYTPAIFERACQMFGKRISWGGTVAGLVAVAAFLAGVAVLRQVTKSTFWATLLAALTAAVGLAVNRNLVDRPLEGEALVADVAIVLAALAAAWLVRVGRTGLLAAAGGVALVLAVAAATIEKPAPVAAAAPPADDSLNLVLVVIDTLRLDVFQRVLEETAEGRAFDRACDGAAWFTNAVAASPWTVPSVGSIMTGRYPPEHGFGTLDNNEPNRPVSRLAESVPTLAEQLRERGYATEAIVTNTYFHPGSGIDRGFTRYTVLSGATTRLPLLKVLKWAGLLHGDPYESAAVVRQRTQQRLARLRARRPFFLWLHLMEPHWPLRAHPDLSPDPAAAKLVKLERRYRDEVRYVLRELTAILELFSRHDLWRETALVLVSDHGEMFPSDGHKKSPKRYGHGHALYGELVRVPLVIRPPGGLSRERRPEVLASHTDLYVTIGDLLGLDLVPASYDQTSLASWLAAEPPPDFEGRSHVLISANRVGPVQRALRTRRFKLIEYPDNPQRPSELYALAFDPREQIDLSGRERGELNKASRRLARAWAELRDPPATAPMELDSETRERLKALGYVQ
ncbi:MAG: sulfatase [bacterium]|nr:sulfatase [bacterium]